MSHKAVNKEDPQKYGEMEGQTLGTKSPLPVWRKPSGDGHSCQHTPVSGTTRRSIQREGGKPTKEGVWYILVQQNTQDRKTMLRISQQGQEEINQSGWTSSSLVGGTDSLFFPFFPLFLRLPALTRPFPLLLLLSLALELATLPEDCP